MQDLVINRTTDTPNVTFMLNGIFKLEGRAFNEDPRKFFDPIISWCRNLSIDTLDFEVRLDYLNTASSKMMVELLKTIDANPKINNKEVKWYFEEDDEDILETGQIIEESTNSTSFFFFKVREAA
jgi:hypothetical protein